MGVKKSEYMEADDVGVSNYNDLIAEENKAEPSGGNAIDDLLGLGPSNPPSNYDSG